MISEIELVCDICLITWCDFCTHRLLLDVVSVYEKKKRKHAGTLKFKLFRWFYQLLHLSGRANWSSEWFNQIVGLLMDHDFPKLPKAGNPIWISKPKSTNNVQYYLVDQHHLSRFVVDVSRLHVIYGMDGVSSIFSWLTKGGIYSKYSLRPV